MISVTQLKPGIHFEEERNVFVVLTYDHIKMARGSGNIKVKARNLSNGAIISKSFITGAVVKDIVPDKIKAQFLYSDGSSLHFMDSFTFEQFQAKKDLVGDKAKFLKEGAQVILLVWNSETLSVQLPKIVELKIMQTGANFSGGRETPGTKEALTETGAKIQVPMFVKTGEIIRVNTETGLYVERAK